MTNEYDRSRWIKTAGKYAEENARLLTEIGRLEEELTEAKGTIDDLANDLREALDYD